jgi:hypothetical protein
MQTLQFQIQDDIYDSIVDKGIDINKKMQDFLYSLVDDGYPSISTNDAIERVSGSVNRYKNGTGIYTAVNNDFKLEMDNYIESL